jgi:hypothetical protein
MRLCLRNMVNLEDLLPEPGFVDLGQNSPETQERARSRSLGRGSLHICRLRPKLNATAAMKGLRRLVADGNCRSLRKLQLCRLRLNFTWHVWPGH